MAEEGKPRSPAQAGESPASQRAAEVGQYCPTCGAKLKDRGCKLKCEQCGFFLSCSDFY
ncbi:MAG TPA: hypothetical protein VLA96_00240 [Terriglobales bacterium]|nr:hypothetical protein [Terriglobales bacterium]